MSNPAGLIKIDVSEDRIFYPPKFVIWLPAVPRAGETVTLPDGHYLVEDVSWQANAHDSPNYPFAYQPQVYYTIRMKVTKKFKEN